MSQLIVFAPRVSERLRYICDEVFRRRVGFEKVRITTDRTTYLDHSGPKVWYYDQPKNSPDNGLWIKSEDLDEPVFGGVNFPELRPELTVETEATPIPDVLKRAFFQLSRMEEYSAGARDAHGRFSAHQSMAHHQGCLQFPVVDEYAVFLRDYFNQLFPDYPFSVPTFRWQPTFDIDIARAYAGRPAWRTFSALVRDLLTGNFQRISEKTAVFRGKQQDPFDTFDWIAQFHENRSQPILFFQVGPYGKFDKNLNPQGTILSTTIQQAKEYCLAVGLHPSYQSNDYHEQVLREKQLLERIAQIPITHSRQHFLKLEFPVTYRRLLAAGLTDDYTMGYADGIGFRAGTSFPFRWYDLTSETATELLIHPFQVMETTFYQYLKMPAEAALAEILPLVDRTRAVGGTFISLWHNNSVSDHPDWKPWKTLYESLAEAIERP